MKVIYIVGMSHSGSTLLDLMLNAHPEIVSVGELKGLAKKLQYKNMERKRYPPCSCGASSLWSCDFWTRVNAAIQQASGKSLGELNMKDTIDVQGFRHSNELLFRAVSEVSGSRLIVDSSKCVLRLKGLLACAGIEVFPIHLMRDAKGQICSLLRKRQGFLRSIFRYAVGHERISRSLKATRHVVVRYEDLVLQPQPTLQSILEPLGLCFDPEQLSWAEKVRHNVAGNRIRRRQRSSELVLDDRWRTALSRPQQVAIDIGTFTTLRLHSRSLTPHQPRRGV